MRAGVSEDAFYSVFSSIDECYRAAYQAGVDRLSQAVATAVGGEQSWLERVRSGLVALLGFFDDEPSWAGLLVLERPGCGRLAFECRQQLQDVLTGLLDEGGDTDTPVGSPMLLPALTGELLVGGVFSVIRSSMLEPGGGRLVELAPSLLAFIAVQHGRPDLAGGLAAWTGELARARRVSRAARLPIRATHRTALVLRAIAQTPYLNNREVANAAGLADEGQASRLLARLARRGVIENVGVGAARGEPNAWLLTPSGRRAVELLDESFARGALRPRRARITGAA